MKSRDHLLRLKRFQVEERRRRVAQIESMVADLDRELANEEQRSGSTDPTHFAYPTYARAAVARRDNLKRSVEELKGQVTDARALYESAAEDLKKTETLDGRDKADRNDGTNFGLGRMIQA